MGRPRSPQSKSTRVVLELDYATFHQVADYCRQNAIARSKLGVSLLRSFLNEPVYIIRYQDPVLYKDSPGPDYPVATKEALGWLVSENDETITIAWGKTINRIPGEKGAAGPSEVLSFPKSSVVEIRRTISP